ncbi:MAG: family 2 glycosyl transferase [Parcubacteria group bacterium Athens0714_24]|nr:MAG: family 2 glycosyl transferase [Parcubacteria group bacterium Athens0714_24]
MFFNFLFFIFIFIIFFGEFLYPKIIYLLPKKPAKKLEEMPDITILIPAYNEEKNIADKIKNTFALNYPSDKREIVVIDNASSDKTYEIASQFPITLLKSEKGKINALNKGLKHAKTAVIVITDADIRLSPESVKNAISHLNGSVGAVSGYIIAKSDGTELMKEKEKYKKRDWELRYQESLVDSVCNLDGKFLVFNKSVFSNFSEDAIVDDYFMTFKIREKGYRLLVEKSAEAYEKLEGGTKEEFRQFRRYALSSLIINFKNIKFLFNPRYGYFGLLTFPFRRFFPVLYPLFLLYIGIFLLFFNFWLMAILFFLVIISLWFYKRLILVQLLAVLGSYVSFFTERDLIFGRWTTIRK